LTHCLYEKIEDEDSVSVDKLRTPGDLALAR
jgi:hypothetical protein